MIEPAARPLALIERVEPDRPPYLEQMRCSRCGNRLVRVYLTVGSVVEVRCHHSVKRPDGKGGEKRETCGWVNTVRPTR